MRFLKAISKKVNFKILDLYRYQDFLSGRSLLEVKLSFILNFTNFMSLVSKSFNIRNMKYFIENILILSKNFINSCHLLPRKIYYLKKS